MVVVAKRAQQGTEVLLTSFVRMRRMTERAAKRPAPRGSSGGAGFRESGRITVRGIEVQG